MYVIEDIFHFVMTCPLYGDLRAIYFESVWQVHVSEQTFYSIMKLTDVDSIFSIHVSKFLISVFELRKNKHIYYSKTFFQWRSM